MRLGARPCKPQQPDQNQRNKRQSENSEPWIHLLSLASEASSSTLVRSFTDTADGPSLSSWLPYQEIPRICHLLGSLLSNFESELCTQSLFLEEKLLHWLNEYPEEPKRKSNTGIDYICCYGYWCPRFGYNLLPWRAVCCYSDWVTETWAQHLANSAVKMSLV